MKKFYKGFAIGFLVYGILISLYLFYSNQAIPEAYINSSADPSTFMSAEQLQKATLYSRIKDFLFFIGIPWKWTIYIIILGLGFSTTFFALSKKLNKRSLFVQSSIYVFLLSALVSLLLFPLQYYSYKVSRDYGISIQPFNLWLADKGKSFLVDFVMTAPMVWLLYVIVRRSPKKWWFWFWLISIPLIILMFFIQPVIIDPIFNDFQYLQDEVLKQDILALAKEAEVPADQVYQVNMSNKTTAMNAYVTGIGSNARIVLWDTTLQKLTKDEIIFIMAHEIGHYVYHHIYWMLLGTMLSSFVLFYAIYRVINWLVNRYGHFWEIKNVGDLNSLPLFLLLLSVVSFAISPIENTISRRSERASDAYAIRMTQNEQAAISTFQKLAVESLVEPNPPTLVKVFLYSHPTVVERIYTITNEK